MVEIPNKAAEEDALGRLRALRARLGDDLGAVFDALASRLRLFEGRAGEGYFSHPMALPILDLPYWIERHLTRRGGAAPSAGRAARLAEAAVVGYLRVRAEDDLLDEGFGDPGEVTLLAGALFARHQALLAREVPPDTAFWDLFEEVWWGYNDAMLLERRLHRGEAPHDAAAFRRVLARSRPLVLPAAAALVAAGRHEDVAPLERFVGALVAAHQLFVDLLHADKDRAQGNITHVLYRLGGEGAREMDPRALRAALYARCGFDRIVDEAREEIERAREAADALSMPEAVAFLEGRARLMTRVQREIFGAIFAGVLSAGPTHDGVPA